LNSFNLPSTKYYKLKIDLNMIFVLVIWTCFDFRPCKKKSLNYIPVKKNYLKKVFGPTFLLIWHGFGHVAVVDYASLVTWRWRDRSRH